MLRVYFLLFANFLFIFSVFAEDKAEVKIGVVAPLTGAMAASAQSFKEACLMAVEDRTQNSKYAYKLIFEDDKLESKMAATAAAKLIAQDKVDALISTWSYGGSVISPLTERAKVIHFSVAWAKEIAKGDFNFLHLTPPKSFIPKILDVLEKRGLKRVSSIVASEAGSLYAADELERLSKDRNIQLLSKVEVPFSERDFKSLLIKEMKKQPEVIYVNMVGAQIDILVSQMRSLGYKTPLVIQTGLSTVDSLSPYEGYWYISDAYFPDDKLEERLVKRTGQHHTLYAANFYDAVSAIIQAYENYPDKTRKPSTSEVLENSKAFSTVTSIFPDLTIDSDGVFNYQPRFYRVISGKAVSSSFEEIINSNWGK